MNMARESENLRAFGLSMEGSTRQFRVEEEITVLAEADETIVYLKRQERQTVTRAGGGGAEPIVGEKEIRCYKCVFDKEKGVVFCKEIKCPE